MSNLCCFVISLGLSVYSFAQTNYSRFVNPFIGTGGHGHTYPGATMPHGMVQLSPDTRLEGWDGCSGYHYTDTFIYGFSHTHLSGTGVSDYGDILLMPMNGKPTPDNKSYGSLFSHSKEKASAGYYSVLLEDDNILAELTVSERVGFHHYRFSKAKDNNLILDLQHRDEVIASSITIEDSVTVTGLRRSKAWATNQYVFFVMKFSRPVTKYGIWQNDQLMPANTKTLDSSRNLKAFFQFDLTTSPDLLVKLAISAVSTEGAKKNLESELPGWNFEMTKSAAQAKWDKELSKIEIQSTDENKLKIFYTALYHTAIVPNINMDVDNRYRGRDDRVHVAEGFTNYSVFSLWDTYRATHPLYTIIDRKRTLDYIQTFLAQYQQAGRLPVWELAGNETDCMIGYHSVPVIVDAYLKGIRGFDTRLALEAMKKSANWDQLGLPDYIKNGLITQDDEHESVSKTLEYAYDDWCIAQFARAEGYEADYLQYIKRAQYYKNVLDTKTGFMRPRKNGDWLSPFDPREVNNNFTEANSWQYSFYMPHDIGGYLELTGGRNALEKKLDELFSAPSQTTGRNQSDITGLIGQYAHGNEPSHHIIYLYNYTKKPYKTQELVHTVMNDFYKNSPDGLIGNEDCGQMSAWYVMSALGIYPVTPGSGVYNIGRPEFPLAKINLENGKHFTIRAPAVSRQHFYVWSASLNNKLYDHSYLAHQDIDQGGVMDFVLSSSPATFLKLQEVPPLPLSEKIVINPVINGGGISFKNKKSISMFSPGKRTTLFYTLDGSEPGPGDRKYKKPFQVNSSTQVKAIAIDEKGLRSFVTTATYKKIPHDWSIFLNTAYEQQYGGGGNDALIDGIRGTVNWRKGNWQGYQKTGIDLVIDLKQLQPVNTVTAGFLQDTRAWIVMPGSLTIEISQDGKNYKEVFKGKEFLPIEDLEVQVKNIEAVFPVKPARYIRLRASQYGRLPNWHEGAGGDTHLFIDEITVK